MPDMEPRDTLVEDAYQRAVDAMTPAQKWARMHQMLNMVRNLYARQVRERLGAVSDEQLKWEVARRLYDSDPKARLLIERKLRDVQS